MPVTPEIRYQQDLTENGYSCDPAQAEAVQHLQALHEQLTRPVKSNFSPLTWFSRKKPAPIKGLYLWGGVGRGKTWLMDMFYDCLPFDNKLRMHFHHFLKHVHDELRQLSGQKDPLEQVARNLARRAKIICFDEFFVADITDAMILAGLLEQLFKQGVTLVTTSNVIPDELYKDGLQRARFLPAIALLNTHTTVLNVDSGTDYRLRILEQADTYYWPLSNEHQNRLQDTFNHLVNDSRHIKNRTPITIAGRTIDCIAQGEGIAWFSFHALCDGPRSQNDYIELGCLFHTVLLEGLPQMAEGSDDQARRFISLIDEFYDRNVTLVITADVAINDLYTGTKLAFEFQRTMSRLQEMQSTDYLSRPHIINTL